MQPRAKLKVYNNDKYLGDLDITAHPVDQKNKHWWTIPIFIISILAIVFGLFIVIATIL